MEIEHSDPVSAKIIQCIIRVHQTLGPGYREIVYKRSLLIELRKLPFDIQVEKEVFIFYEGVRVGRHVIDIIVDPRILIELKTVDALNKAHYAQVKSYLKATGLPFGLLVNFQRELADYRHVRSPHRRSNPPISI